MDCGRHDDIRQRLELIVTEAFGRGQQLRMIGSLIFSFKKWMIQNKLIQNGHVITRLGDFVQLK